MNAEEQRLFRRLAVFAGGCTLEGAEAVCNAARDLGIDVVDGVSSLVNKSLSYRQERLTARSASRCSKPCVSTRESNLRQRETSASRGVLTPPIALSSPKKAIRTSPRGTRGVAVPLRCRRRQLPGGVDWLVEDGDAELALRLGLALFWFWERREHLVEGRRVYSPS